MPFPQMVLHFADHVLDAALFLFMLDSFRFGQDAVGNVTIHTIDIPPADDELILRSVERCGQGTKGDLPQRECTIVFGYHLGRQRPGLGLELQFTANPENTQ